MQLLRRVILQRSKILVELLHVTVACSGHDSAPLLLEVLVDLVHEALSDEIVGALGDLVAALDEDGEILSHGALLDSVDDGLLEGLREESELLVTVELGTVAETAGPREDGGDRVGRGRTTLLPDAVVTGDGAVGSLSLHDIVAVDADGGHETEGAEALSDNVGLDVAIVVLAGPDEAAVALDDLSDDVVDESVLVVEALSLHLLVVLLAVDALECVDEEAVVLLENGVLGGHLQGEVPVESVAEAGARKSLNRFLGVEHAEVDAAVDVSDVLHGGLAAVGRGELNLNRTGLSHDVVLAAVLVTERVSANDDGLGPAWHAAGNIGNHNRLSEHGTVKDISDGSIGAPPHLLEVELLDTALIGSDGGALDGDLVLLGGVSGINRDLVVGGVAGSHRQVVVLSLEVEVGVDMALLDPLPDDARHLVTVDVNNGVGNLHLSEGRAEASLGGESGKH
eukprot:CAMPEP_0170461958 /NCGR_PEP_ID=MMETSP0123-20130129/7655_1 /TAXON_ID=182087 /ORGANISM="Favella ehrenbergii, Strain Fehren 1" /LENGTH=452 /DNA_ID=CAMNT_0010727081 /DNA_START=45 /DNA_END=1403 /DNA_ORIENTATION=-